MDPISYTLSCINARMVSLLDAVAVLAAKVLPIDGAGVFYWHSEPAWVGVGKSGDSRSVRVGRYEVVIDFRTPDEALVSGS